MLILIPILILILMLYYTILILFQILMLILLLYYTILYYTNTILILILIPILILILIPMLMLMPILILILYYTIHLSMVPNWWYIYTKWVLTTLSRIWSIRTINEPSSDRFAKVNLYQQVQQGMP